MRFKAVFIKESILISRDKRALFLTILFPVFMLILYSYGVTFDIKHVQTAVLDYNRSPQSRDLIQILGSSEYLDVKYNVDSYDQIQKLFLENKSILALIIPLDFNKKINMGEKVVVQILANGSDANTVSVALGYQAAAISSYSVELVRKKISSRGFASMAGPGVLENVRVWYNPELKSTYFIVPGIIAIVMMLLGSLLTSTSIVREKDTGTIEMLVSTPIKSVELIMGKVLPYVIISFVDIIIIIVLGHYCFGVPIKGSLLLLMPGALLFLFCALGFGLLASAAASTVSSSQMIALFIGLLPSILLSGFIFPIESMPKIVQAITCIVPAKYFIIILRGIFLKGVGIDVLWPQILYLFVFGTVLLFFSASKFEKRIG